MLWITILILGTLVIGGVVDIFTAETRKKTKVSEFGESPFQGSLLLAMVIGFGYILFRIVFHYIGM